MLAGLRTELQARQRASDLAVPIQLVLVASELAEIHGHEDLAYLLSQGSEYGIRVVAAGDALLSPSVTRHLIEEYVRRPVERPSAAAALEGLTEREVEVLVLVARGLSNSEIAEQLFVSPATAKTHVGRLLMKLDARDRAQLIVMAYESGLVSPRAR